MDYKNFLGKQFLYVSSCLLINVRTIVKVSVEEDGVYFAFEKTERPSVNESCGIVSDKKINEKKLWKHPELVQDVIQQWVKNYVHFLERNAVKMFEAKECNTGEHIDWFTFLDEPVK
jgi:hypothetical protein